jgi:tetratricopeptide (TPR) repeat protein|tara:strand:- start:1944 stop:3638 length:1695 start_codon:yes stop_codon:yes gene_type:complete
MKEDHILSFDLGSRAFAVSTESDMAQRLFDQGLNWCFGFNQEEGLACFKKALEFDSGCAMLHWGAAYAAGPFYNMPWCDFSEPEAVDCTTFCRGHIDQALALSDNAMPLEAALIRALAVRVQRPHTVSQSEYDGWDDAYAEAMRKVYSDFPENQDVMALLVEAMMTRTPWRLWDVKAGLPTAGADTLEAIAVCEKAVALADESGEQQHPAILHLHIHLLEMSPAPERAMDSADRLGGLCPDAGHIHHMPGHIYVLCGEYEKARIASEAAIHVDRKYLAYAGPYNYYTTARCHDLHLMMYTCMLLGQFEPAMAAAQEICDNLPPDVIDLKDKPFIASTMEGYYAMKMHVLVRFGKWREIIDTPMPQDPKLYCVSTCMHHYAKGIAYAAMKEFTEAEDHQRQFYDSLERVHPGRKFFNNPAIETLGVGEKMLLGELEYHKGNHEIAYAHLRESVQRCDDLHYSEPWPWMHPPRHALGALLMEQGHYKEAEEVYRADLGLNDAVQRCAQHKNNVWSLHGLVECLKHRGETKERTDLQVLLTTALARTDIAVTSSCCCRKTVVDIGNC